jgi:hypothetical protein
MSSERKRCKWRRPAMTAVAFAYSCLLYFALYDYLGAYSTGFSFDRRSGSARKYIFH